MTYLICVCVRWIHFDFKKQGMYDYLKQKALEDEKIKEQAKHPEEMVALGKMILYFCSGKH